MPITNLQIDLKDDNAELVSDEHIESDQDVIDNELYVYPPHHKCILCHNTNDVSEVIIHVLKNIHRSMIYF